MLCVLNGLNLCNVGIHGDTAFLPAKSLTFKSRIFLSLVGYYIMLEFTMEQRRRVPRRLGQYLAGCIVTMLLLSGVSAQLKCSISEEVNEETVVGNIAKDLELDKSTLKDRKYRIVSNDAEPLFRVNQDDGVLYVSQKIDREKVCLQSSTCLLNVKTVLENPLEVHYVVVEVLDVNDHSPVFQENELTLEISESVFSGA